MLKCGDYTLDRPVGWGRTATYYTAFAGEEAGDMRLVVRYSRSADRRHVQSFLKSAAEQQTAVSSGCRRVAPVLDFGVAETGHAYRVNLGSEISLAELIQAGNSVDHDYLRTIITGTLRGLTELRDKFKRPHGNLSAGNILLDRNGEVLLTDLSPSALEGRHSDDLRALGGVIYQVVRQSLKIGFLSPPLETSPEWTNVLGDHADDWRELTNRLLLTKTGEGAASLERAVKELKSLASLGEQATVVPVAASSGPSSAVSGPQSPAQVPTPRARKRRWRLAVAALGVLSLGGIAAALFWRGPTIDPPKITPPPPLAYFKKLIPPASALKSEGALLRQLNGASGLNEMWTYVALWTAPAKLKSIQGEWQKPPRQWDALAKEITPPAELQLKTTVFSEQERERWNADAELLATALQKLGPTSELLASAESLQEQWDGKYGINDLCKQLANREDSKRLGIPDFSDWSCYAIRESGSLQIAIQRAGMIKDSLRAVEVFLQKTGSRVHSRLKEQGPASIPRFSEVAFTKPDQLWPQLWIAEARKLLRPEFETIDKWEAGFKEITKRIESRPPEEQTQLKQELKRLQADSLDILVGDATKFEERIAEMRKAIKSPLEDLDAEFWAAVAEFNKDVHDMKVVPDSATAQARSKLFSEKIYELLNKNQYQPVSQAFFNRNSLNSKSFLDALQKATEEKGFSKPKITTLPGGWKQRQGPDESGVTIEWPEKKQTLTFLMVGDKFAMSTTEISFGIVTAIMEPGVRNEPPLAGALGFRDQRPPKEKNDLFTRWLWPKAAAAVAIKSELRAAIPVRDIDSCPMTWVSAARATAIAAKFGARLPTQAEWTMAVANNSSQTQARLRGTAFVTATSAMADLVIDGKDADVDEGSFPFPNTGQGRFQGKVLNDSFPWFIPVGSTEPSFGKFIHLVGNAAEWVTDGGSVFAAGGSCLTPPDADVVTPTKAPNQPAIFSDVSFRLVLPVTPGNPNAALEAIRVAAEQLAASRPPQP